MKIESSEVCRVCGKSHGAVPCPDQATQLALSQASLSPGAPPPGGCWNPPSTAAGTWRRTPWSASTASCTVSAKVAWAWSTQRSTHSSARRSPSRSSTPPALTWRALPPASCEEARAAALGQHPNLIQAFDFGQLTDGRYYLVMEFLEGESLSTYLRRHGPLSYRRALPILDGILAGLKAAHDKGIVHRDLKPKNVWICAPTDEASPAQKDGGADPGGEEVSAARIKLLDFGLAKLVAAGPGGQDTLLTRAGTPMGTPAFMSPEQCRGQRDIDHRTDIYSLGVIMWELFTGTLPFRGDSYVDVLHQHMTAAPPSMVNLCDMPPDLESVIDRALAKLPADRFESAAELRAALHGCTLAADFTPHYRAPSAKSGYPWGREPGPAARRPDRRRRRGGRVHPGGPGPSRQRPLQRQRR